MHFGRAIYSIHNGDILTVVAPIDYLFCLAVLVASALVAALLNVKYPRSFVPWIWNGLGTLIVLGLVSANATVKLDAHQGKVFITRVLFFYPTREVFDLAGLTGATVRDADQADALRLVFANGTNLQLTPYTQMDGKEQTAAAINDFVQAHGGSTSELR
jgi:hypothetical protein